MDNKTPDGRSISSTWALAGRHILLYALWLTICAIGFWLIFRIRANLVEGLFFLQVNPWQLRALDRWVLYGLGLCWIVSIFLVEGYLRSALNRGRLLPIAGRILFIGLALIGLSYIITHVV